MKINWKAFIVGFVLTQIVICLTGCGAHLKNRTENEKIAAASPKPKVTRTVTETVKVERPVPVYQTVTTTTSATKTLDDKGKPAADLHKVTIPIPEPTK